MGFEKSNREYFFTKKNKLNLSCIIPAAGLSSRMGCWKGELKTREGLTFIENAVLSAFQACLRVVVVGGFHYDRLLNLLSDLRAVDIVYNDKFENGMVSSIQKGLESIEGRFFIMPMDMPLIRPETFFSINDVSACGKINRPVYNHIPGHPVLFPETWKKNIMGFKGEGLRSLIGPDDQNLVTWEDHSVVYDIDSMDDYRKYLNSLKS